MRLMIILSLESAAVAEQADARDLKSRDVIHRTGSIPVSGTISSRRTVL